MKSFLQNIYIVIVIYMPLIIIAISLFQFFIQNKQNYFRYILFILNMILLILITLLMSMTFSKGDDRFGFAIEHLFLFTSSLIFITTCMIKIYFNYKNNTYEDTHIYFIKKNYKYLLKSFLITLIIIFSAFQFFLIWSAYNAYEQARELGYIGREYSIISFYSPLVKTIKFNNKRYSYHRARYVDLNE